VVDARGDVVCALSHSDLRALTPNDFGLLALPLGEFLVLQRTLAASPRGAGLAPAAPAPLGRAPDWRARLPAAAPLAAVRADAPLRALLARMLDARVHRVFILDGAAGEGGAAARHAGVVSMTDVLRAVADARCA
jgi:CBS-domain-containing membrane protein